MATGYPFKEIEEKWQAAWAKDNLYRAHDGVPKKNADKFYGLVEFPYPSGEGLHVGHPRSFTAIDILTRKKRMEGKNVLYPMGWDAFGLPTENFAIKHKVKPQDATMRNIANFKRQLISLGFGFDWSREINTSDPSYYRWTQWMFLRFFNAYFDTVEGRARPIDELAIPDIIRAKGDAAVRTYIDGWRLAYKTKSIINWCPRCKTGLANEEARGCVCERCESAVEQRTKSQWMLRITVYADRLIRDLDTVDYLDKITSQQLHWIGRSEGAYVDFQIKRQSLKVNSDGGCLLPDKVTVFTTRPDTLFGTTYLVLAPEHPLIETWIREGNVTNADKVRAYQNGTRLKSELERKESKEKTGIELKGVMAKNPVNGKMISVWTADYVLGGYGTGAIMAVPAHDERDFEFAKTFGLPASVVVAKVGHAEVQLPFIDEGIAINSGAIDHLKTAQAKDAMIEWLEQNAVGERKTTYRLRDWVFSRQRYWGEPIPIVLCKACGFVPVSDDQLPVILPDVEKYEPIDTGESPLATIRDWVETTCPRCGNPAERETDTMPNWAGSSWYFLRYCDPQNNTSFADTDKLRYWMPVDLYNGGMEHTTLHLLYSRFWYKVLWDLDLVPRECGSEPYAKRRSQALILGEGGIKMSKSKGNVVNPDHIVAIYGADVFRVYEMFIGPFDQDAPWDTNGIEGVKRFLDKVWRMYGMEANDRDLPNSVAEDMNAVCLSESAEMLLNQTIKKVSDDIEAMHYNTAVSALMILANELSMRPLTRYVAEVFLKLLAPFAPHLTDELWHRLGHETSVHIAGWPIADPSKLIAAMFELVVQINGKVRDRIVTPSDISQEGAIKLALASKKVKDILSGKAPKKVMYVKGRLVSISF